MKEDDFTFVDNSDKVLQELAEKSDVILEAWGLLGERYAKESCPVDTGRLRDSITHAQDGNSELIGTNVEYAVPVETGHIMPNGKFVKPQPFIQPAVENHGTEYRETAKKYLSK